MIMKRLLGGTAMLLAIGMPAAAQVAPDMGPRPSLDQLEGENVNPHTPETLGAGRQMGGTPGDQLAQPADPRVPTTGPSTEQRQPATEDRAATNADTASPAPPTRDDDTAETGGDPAARPADRNTEPAQTVMGTRGGGALTNEQIYADDLSQYKVVNGEGDELGSVAGLVVNVETGRIDTLILSRGGLVGIGEELYDVPWDRVSSFDKRAEQLLVDLPEVGLRPEPEFLPGGAEPGGTE